MYENVSHLLIQVGLITRKYDEIAAITGEKFNIFSIMRMESNEVYTHSAFIAELLNPKGSHGLKDKLLNLLLEQLKEQFKSGADSFSSNLKTEDAWTVIEEYIGIVDNEKQTGGKIDIVVKDNSGNAIVIENKIYASEQDYQLSRYKNAYKLAPILFLTLSGHKPTSCEGLTENKHYFCISYEKTILNWLEECLKAAVMLPMLREVLKQYIFLIKKLTYKTTINNMGEEILGILSKDITASFSIFENQYNLKKLLVKKLCSKVKVYAESHGLKFLDDEDINDRWYGFSIKGSENEKLFIRFEFQKHGFGDLIGGLVWFNDIDNNEALKIKSVFQNNGYRVSPQWVYKHIYYGNGTSDTWNEFDNGEILKQLIFLHSETFKILNNI